MYVDPILQPLFTSLQHLVTAPVCPSDLHSGISLISNMRLYTQHITCGSNVFVDPKLEQIFGGMRKNMTEELASLLDFATTTNEAFHRLLFPVATCHDTLFWVEAFERLLVRMNNMRPFSDLGVQAAMTFVSRFPKKARLVFASDSKFSIKVEGRTVTSLDLPTQSFCALFTPARPHHTTAILTASHTFVKHLDSQALVRMIQSGWFSNFFEAIPPSTLPFTTEIKSLHTRLIEVMKECLIKICDYDDSVQDDQDQNEMDDIYRSFHNQTKDYLVHLSHHPFALVTDSNLDIVIDFFIYLFQHSGETSVRKPFQDELRQAMDESALSSSSLPFILTSEMVCDLTDDEIMNVVDRIVALIASDSPLDDDTILRICAFHKNRLRSLYLPELFRKSGRTTEQFFHTLESLLSLPVESFYLTPFFSLVIPKPNTLPPTFDEWDDVDLETVGVVMRMISLNQIAYKYPSVRLLAFIEEILPQTSLCATRLNLSHLARLINPAIAILTDRYFQPRPCRQRVIEKHQGLFVKISKLCDQRVVAQCLSRVGFFSRVVIGLLGDRSLFDCGWMLEVFIRQSQYPGNDRTERKKHQFPIPHCLEEGWQDVLDVLFLKNKAGIAITPKITLIMGMMHFHGTNLDSRKQTDF